MTKTANINNLNKDRQGEGLIACSVLLRSFSEPLSIFVKTAEAQMITKHYVPFWDNGQAWVLRRSMPELGNNSPTRKVQHYKSYLKASIVAYQKNCRLTNLENEHKELFAGGVK